MALNRNVHVPGKWIKTKVLLRDRETRRFVPETRKFGKKPLSDMLRRYRTVYIKPAVGTHGKGVMRIDGNGNGEFTSQLLFVKRRHRSFESLYLSLRKIKSRTPYLIQQGIRLLKYRGRLFDIRVMVQKDPKGRWTVTGIIGRVAHPRKIVTNYHGGGRPMDIRPLLIPHVGKKRISEFESKLSQTALKSARVLGRAFPGTNMVGADIGIDSDLRPWIIELNTRPDPYLFRFLKDKKTARRVLRFARALRRIPYRTRHRRRVQPRKR